MFDFFAQIYDKYGPKKHYKCWFNHLFSYGSELPLSVYRVIFALECYLICCRMADSGGDVIASVYMHLETMCSVAFLGDNGYNGVGGGGITRFDYTHTLDLFSYYKYNT